MLGRRLQAFAQVSFSLALSYSRLVLASCYSSLSTSKSFVRRCPMINADTRSKCVEIASRGQAPYFGCFCFILRDRHSTEGPELRSRRSIWRSRAYFVAAAVRC